MGKGEERRPDDIPTKDAALVDDARHRLCLLVIGDGVVTTHALPDSGRVSIGRSTEEDVRIDVTTVSRSHAVLHIGESLAIEDLGSANGTKVRGSQLSPGQTAPIAPGDPIELGTNMLIVHLQSSSRTPRRIWSHGYFEGRVDDECARARRTGARFAVARFRVGGDIDIVDVQEAMLAGLQPGDGIGTYSPGDYEVLLVETDPEGAARTVRQIESELRRSAASMRVGVATYPRDGRSGQELIAKASAALMPASAATHDEPIIIGHSAMEELYALVERVAVGTINVLLQGETGVGKEVFAERIHRLSPRCDAPLVRLNCAALSESLLESELFGHEKGAFTGAVRAKPGLLETAEGGTVFLDEIGDLPPSLQAKLLRVIEDGKVLRVGSLEPRNINVRYIAATHRDLEAAIERGTFRQDLYFRLNGVSLVIPPLRERVAEVEPIALAFLARACRELRRAAPRLDDAVRALLVEYSWPGNVRELRNTMERAALMCTGDVVTADCLPVDKMSATLPPAAPRQGPLDLRARKQQSERDVIIDALDRANGNQTRAAKLLGIARRTLITKMQVHGLREPRNKAR